MDIAPATDRFRPAAPVAAVLAVVIHDGNALLVQRKNPPDANLWGFPGGKLEAGESIFSAARRELHEETGVDARPLRVLDCLDSIFHDPDGELLFHYVLIVVQCAWEKGHPLAADDALDAEWVPLTELDHGRVLSQDVLRIAGLAAQQGSSI